MERFRLSRYIAFLLLLITTLASKAQEKQEKASYSFLEIPYSSHAFALGGAGIAIIDDDVSLSGTNPGLLGPEIEKQVSFNYMHYLGDSNFAGVHYAQGVGRRGAWSAGIQYLGYGSAASTNPDGTEAGSFSMKDIVVNGMYSHDFTDRLRGGINIKMISSNYESYSAFAMAADLGLNYYNEETDMSLSLVLKNMGGQLKRFDQEYTHLPFDIQLGWMQRLGTSPFMLSVTAWHLNKWSLPYYTHPDNGGMSELKDSFFSNLMRHLVFGLQYSPSERFYIALGYNNQTRTDMSTYKRNFLSGFSAGFGLKVKGFALGASYAQPHKAGSSVMVNLSMNIQELLRR